MEKKEENLRFILVLSIILTLIIIPLFIINGSAFTITTDETTETSIIWNLSALPNTTNISTIALDGIMLEGYIPNPKQIVQNNLYAGETHLIVVLDDSGNESTGTAKTIIPNTTENEKLAANMNLYFLFAVALCCLIIGIFVPYIALGSVVICIIGIINAFNHSFLMGMIFFIALIASIWISITNLE